MSVEPFMSLKSLRKFLINVRVSLKLMDRSLPLCLFLQFLILYLCRGLLQSPERELDNQAKWK